MILSFGTFLPLVLGTAFSNICGDYGCLVMAIGSLFNTFPIALGGTAIAIYRLLTIRIMSHLNRHKQMNTVLIIASSSMVFICIIYMTGIYLSPTVMTIQYCYGMSDTGIAILKGISNENIQDGKGLINFTGFVWLALIIVEAVCYVRIFRYISHHDKKIGSKVLSQAVLQQRKSRNVITFGGQVITFCLTFVAYILASFILNRSEEFLGIEPAAYPLGIIFVSAARTMIQFFTSPEMKRYYLKL